MDIKATDEQVKKMAAAAINSSMPMGMGFLHHIPEMRVKPEELEIKFDQLSIDYYQGRMVKFHARRLNSDTWSFHPDNITSDYQSWIRDYDSYQTLFNAVAKD